MNAEELDRKFDNGEDISKYLDLPGIRRPGQEKRVNADLPVIPMTTGCARRQRTLRKWRNGSWALSLSKSDLGAVSAVMIMYDPAPDGSTHAGLYAGQTIRTLRRLIGW